MTERLHPVRLVHQHLRRAASLLEQRQFDAASAEVEAALSVDPASLTARTLHEKIQTARLRPVAPRARAVASADPPPAPPADLSTAALAEADRFIPSGVDAYTWLGFEHRIEERRFRALLEAIAVALRTGDAVGAQLALDEARELRPDAPELDTATDQIAVLPVLMPLAPERTRLGMRALGAVSLLACGVSLLVGLDAVRSTQEAAPASIPAAEPVTMPEAPRADIAMPKMADVPVPLLPSPLAVDTVVGTVGVRPVLAIESAVQRSEPHRSEPQRSGQAKPPVTPAARTLPAVVRALPPVGEIPDDYVAPTTALVGRDVPALVTPPSRTPVAQPRDVTAAATVASSASAAPPNFASSMAAGGSANVTPAAAPSAVVLATAAIVAPRVDENGVTLALNQYARAYGRLDAGAARAVWPSVDERALARAFAGLESQQVSFDRCDIDVHGTTANASCHGQASYVGKVGSREQRTEPRQWRFELRRDGDAWKIESAEARRVASY